MTTQKKPIPIPNKYKFLFGGTAGCCATCFVQPLDLLKNRMQMSGAGARTKEHKTSIHLLIDVVKKEGILPLYNGLSAGILRQATYTTTRLGIYTWLFDLLTYGDKPPNFFFKTSIAMIAGVSGAFVGTPADVALIRMTSDGRLPPEKRRNYKNVVDALIRMAREEGLPTWFKGAVPTMGRAMTSSPRYPRSNGLAERFVQTAKNIIRKSDDIWVALMEYRNTPITNLKRSPAALLFYRKLKTKLPLLEEPSFKIKEFRNELTNRNNLYKKYYHKHAKERSDFKEGEIVVYRDENQWRPATILSKHEAPRSYLINTGSNVLRRNSNHLRSSEIKHDLSRRQSNRGDFDFEQNTPSKHESVNFGTVNDGIVAEPCITENTGTNNFNSDSPGENQKYTRSNRSIKKPSRFTDYVMY